MDTLTFITSTRHLDCFCHSSVTNKAMLTNLVHMSFSIYLVTSIYLGKDSLKWDCWIKGDLEVFPNSVNSGSKPHEGRPWPWL